MADPAPDQAAPAAAPPAAAPAQTTTARDTVKVKVAWPTESFETSIADVGIITRTPRDIFKANLEEVQAAAKRAGVTVIEIKEQ